MRQAVAGKVPPPRADDRLMRDVLFGISGYAAVLVAHDLKLYPLLAKQALTLSETCDALNIAPRAAEALISVSTALGLLEERDGRFSPTPIAEDYLLEGSATYFGDYFDMMIQNYSVYSFESLKRAVLTDRPQFYGGEEVFTSHQQRADRVRAYTCAMHGTSMAAALAWPKKVDLSGHRLMLDIGGGSGAHAIGAVQQWGELKAVVFDLAPVCGVAEEFIDQHGVRDRVTTHVGDMWSDAFPRADVHLYSQVYHDWPPDKCQQLVRKSYEALAPGGRLILHEMLYNDRKTGPFATAAMNISMLLWYEEGRQYSGAELSAMLREAGFSDIKVTPTFGHYSVVTGRKSS
jgi:cyclopropane fatty-acyl-phospholipid synthase-like methyltransferase